MFLGNATKHSSSALNNQSIFHRRTQPTVCAVFLVGAVLAVHVAVTEELLLDAVGVITAPLASLTLLGRACQGRDTDTTLTFHTKTGTQIEKANLTSIKELKISYRNKKRRAIGNF